MKSNSISNKDIMSLFWRAFLLPACYSMDRMQAPGFAYSMIPVLKKLYSGNDLKDALVRHSEVYNTTFAVSPFILGITTAMEEEASKDEYFDKTSISAIKVALMGPLAGIGDTFFWGTFRIIGSGIGSSLAMQGNIMGPILFLLIYNIPNLLVRYYGVKLGYKLGSDSIQNLVQGGLMNKATKAAGILGLVVIGGMIATMVSLELSFVPQFNGAEVNLQSIIDEICPKLLPLLLTFGIYKLLQRNVKSYWIMLGVIAFGIIGKGIGLL